MADRDWVSFGDPSGGAGFVATTEQVRSDIRRLWARVLQIDESAVHDRSNFFELGGSSLAALQVGSLLLDAYDVELSVVDLLELDELDRLARHVADITGG